MAQHVQVIEEVLPMANAADPADHLPLLDVR